MTQRKQNRQNMQIGTYPRHVLLRMKPNDFYRLHQRAAENRHSLNYELNLIVKEALDPGNGKGAITID